MKRSSTAAFAALMLIVTTEFSPGQQRADQLPGAGPWFYLARGGFVVGGVRTMFYHRPLSRREQKARAQQVERYKQSRLNALSARSDEALQQRRATLEAEELQLMREQRAAWSEFQGGWAMAQPFANMRPQLRFNWTYDDFINGTIIDANYTREPVVELSPASPRYGYIARTIASAQSRLCTTIQHLAAVRIDLGAIDAILSQRQSVSER